MIQWNVANPSQRITSTLPFMPCRDPKLPYPGPETFIHLVQNSRGPPLRGIYVLEWIAWVWSLSQAKMTMPFPSPTPHLILWRCVIFSSFSEWARSCSHHDAMSSHSLNSLSLSPHLENQDLFFRIYQKILKRITQYTRALQLLGGSLSDPCIFSTLIKYLHICSSFLASCHSFCSIQDEFEGRTVQWLYEKTLRL